MNRSKAGKYTGLVLILITLLIILRFQASTLNEFPSHIHAWSQADRYALAIGFTENGENLFLPETYNLNPQFPARTALSDPQGITAVDFPLPDYLASWIMKISGSRAPWTFRLLTLLTGLAGMAFLFILARRAGANRLFAFAIILFLLLSPVYAYYLNGFIPSVSSLSLLFAGWYYYYRYLQEKTPGLFLAAVSLLALSALIRTGFAIFLIALAGERFLSAMASRKVSARELISLSLAFVVIAAYFLYNQHLRNVYGSVFLAKPLPPASVAELADNFRVAWLHWRYHYLTRPHYLILLVLFLTALYHLIVRRRTASRVKMTLTFYTLISAIGVILYAGLLSVQFRQHDYYFLDTFLPLLILVLLLLIPDLDDRPVYEKFIAGILLPGLLVWAFAGCDQTLKERRSGGKWSRVENTIRHFTGSDRWLDSIGTGRDARILVPGTPSPNIPFILMDRKGYSLLTTSRATWEEALREFSFDYVVIQDYYLQEDVLVPFPEFPQHFKRIAGNGMISVYKQDTLRQVTDLDGFLQLEETSALNTRAVSELSPDEKYKSIFGAPDSLTAFRRWNTLVVESSRLPAASDGQIRLVCSRSSGEKLLYYKEYLLPGPGKDTVFSRNIFLLPETADSLTTTSLYLYNPAKSDARFGNFSVLKGKRTLTIPGN
ncbi:MAG: ArnT family glycosyltransferase [Bacteroidota bacterium]